MFALPRRRQGELFLERGQAPTQPTRSDTERRRRAHAANMRASGGAARRSPHRSALQRLDRKSRADLALLTTELPTGPIPMPGSHGFGPLRSRRDHHGVGDAVARPDAGARRVAVLGARPGAGDVHFQASAPGKIMHETRRGEMTALGEVPFGRYYGSVDTTPLFVMLAGAYAARTADLELIAELWPALEAAMGWIEGAGDPTATACSTTSAARARGSPTRVGRTASTRSSTPTDAAEGSRRARRGAGLRLRGVAGDGGARGAPRRAGGGGAWRRKRSAARRGGGALLDGGRAVLRPGPRRRGAPLPGAGLQRRPSAVGRAAGAGAGGAGDPAAALVAVLDSGLGDPTLPRGETRFDPMSYHNGSVWPHDTALFSAAAWRATASATASSACSPQPSRPRSTSRCGCPSCSAASTARRRSADRLSGRLPSASLVGGGGVHAARGLSRVSIDGRRRELHVERPQLPVGIDRLTLSGLAVGDSRVDLTFQRLGRRVVASAAGRGAGSVVVLTRV